MTKTYNVLWIDDEFEDLVDFILAAEGEGILLNGYESYEEGIAELKANLHRYDAVLFDARFFKNKTQSAGTEDLKGLAAATVALTSLEEKKRFPRFIYTGQKDLSKDSSFNETYVDFYDGIFSKHSVDDDERLFAAIRAGADDQVDTQIRHTHNRVFELCTDEYIGKEAAIDLLKILKSEEQAVEIDAEKYVTPLRKVIEDLFEAFNKNGLLPDEFVTPRVALNETSKFLSGRTEKGFTLNTSSKLPSVVSQSLRNILSVVQGGAHRSEIDNHLKLTRTPYLLYSITYQLLDTLVWFKQHVDSGATQQDWTKEEQGHGTWHLGAVTKIAPNGYGTFLPHSGARSLSILPKMVSEHRLNEDELIEVITEPSPDGTKTFIKKIRRPSAQ